MNRLLATTAIGLLLGLAPALAQDTAEPQTPPAVQDPAQPSEALPSMPSEPATPIPGDEANPQAAPDKSSPPSAQAPSSEPASPPSAEAPQAIEPAAPKSAEAAGDTKFLSKQESTDMLASSLLGQSVVNSQDEIIGDINDLVTDESGKVIAVLVGSGGFLGIGEKDVALGFEDLRFARDENNNIKVIANVTKETLASAPDYETLAEQQVTVGENKGDREDLPQQ
jgi:sporulation protein YlmC with PRC-barrel domain